MDILEQIASALATEERVVLATIVSSSGSTPVPAGARMLMTGAGRIPLGTVGGGCLEAEVQQEARRMLGAGSAAMLRTFRLTEDDIESGMACGGSVDILIEPLEQSHAGLFAQAVQLREEGKDCMVLTALSPERTVVLKLLLHPLPPAEEQYRSPLAALGAASGPLPASLDEAIARAHRRLEILRTPVRDGEVILEPVIGHQDLIIFGGGHVSTFVSRSAAMAGFRVTVIDDRPEYANAGRFPEATRTMACFFENAWDDLRISPSSSLVIVTRGHKYDEMILERAVRTPARYIGMIGSKRKVLTTFRNLRERGVPEERLLRVRAPIGLRIGSVTAEEIGISITAELIAVRRGVLGPAAPMSDGAAGGPAPERQWRG